MKYPGFFFVFLLLLFYSCKKEHYINSTDARVRFSADTLKFDTVFTTAGSVTYFFKILNDNNQKLRLTAVQLMGGINSAFKINVDGFPGPSVSGIDIAAHDSIYVFVSVNINPAAGNLPFVIRDSIKISYNGIDKQVQLEAWGQNAHFLRNKKISADEVWSNDLPYVILGSLVIESDKTLTLSKGCRIYVHADAPILVDGTLLVNGLKDSADRVIFRSDRLDEPYKNFPAGWPGIFLRTSSKNNVFTYAVIKNAYQAIALQDPSPNSNPKLVLNECIIDNAYDAGIIALNSSIRARNSLISNCGKNILLAKGGSYLFTHCTVASISNGFIFHRNPVLFLSNYILVNNTPVSSGLDAVFRNCIFWGENGTVEDEVVVAKNGNTAFSVNFDTNLWKVQTTPTNIIFNQVINNQSPQFDSINVSGKYYDFRLKATSPAINKGVPTGIATDLDGKPRTAGLPDLGCFERQ